MRIRIEDNFEDVLEKAATGLNLSRVELADKSGLDGAKVKALFAGEFDAEAARRIAPLLDLDTDSLLELGEQAWYPESVELDGLRLYNTPFPVPGYEEMTVNSYLVWDPETRQAAVFDSGANAEAMLKDKQELALEIRSVFLTHTHRDHIAALEPVQTAAGGAPTYVHEAEAIDNAESIREGERFELGGLTIEARRTSGHSPGGTTYVIHGLKRPVAIVGDALFCGSMGGAPGAFKEALENNRREILSLPDETVLCPGHGPMTSVSEEKRHNPFFPEYK